MKRNIKEMIKEFPEKITDTTIKCPWNKDLFKVKPNAKKLLSKEKGKSFHTFVAKLLFISKRTRSDIQPAVAYLTTRVKQPNEYDWNKLVRVMHFLKTTKDDVLKLQSDGTRIRNWHVDASFATHNDLRSHIGAIMPLGKGTVQTVSTK
jgi:hypothetical protein